MLKRLELVGFKSFADRTVFEFSSGLTAIVGPNGSGKSNVVDAVKWVLGEQSAKSLRGGEMADVIFSGSSTRKSLGMAEVTLTFDNTAGALRTPAAEVQITRRVYRDGEGEYLINGQPSRLKDIKELFLGTGAGAGAYCIIEQGRVDALLQASTSERRSIFEEAAGISRFKAKKIESLRRLERVDANLQRLRDILAEVENQLRSVRLQAAKAQRYQEYTQRLRELRLDVGLREYRSLTRQWQEAAARLSELRADLTAAAERSAEFAAASHRLETDLARLDGEIRTEELALANGQVARTAHASALAHERAQAGDLETEIARTRGQLSDELRRCAESAAERDAAQSEWAAADAQCQAEAARAEEFAERLRRLAAEIARLRQQIEADQSEHVERLRLAARMQNEAVSAKAHFAQLQRERDRLSQKNAQAAEHLATLDVELETLTRADADLQDRMQAHRQALGDRSRQLEDNRRRVENARHALAVLRARHAGLISRIDVLENLERSHEGLGSGIREVLAELGAGPLTPCVVGLVGNLLSAPRDVAHLLDIALGSAAAFFVVRDADQLVLALTDRRAPLSGRVSFIPVRRQPPQPIDCTIPCPPAVVRADRLVSCDLPELAGLPEQLLGRTWLAPTLAMARDLAGRLPGQRFVTHAGELLESDGTLTVGAHRAEAGILSRKSELRELQRQASELAAAIDDADRAIADDIEQGDRLEGQIRGLQQELDVLGEQAADLRERIGQRRERRDGLHEEVALARTELSGIDAELNDLAAKAAEAEARAISAEAEAQDLQSRIAGGEAELRARDHDRLQAQNEQTAARVGLAQLEERRHAVHQRHAQLDREVAERQTACNRIRDHESALAARLTACLAAQLQASADLAETCAALERAGDRLDAARTRRDAVHSELRQLHDQMQIAHDQWQARQDETHACELRANDVRIRREALIQRLREEQQIDLEEEDRRTATPTADGPAGDAVEAEIDDLRKKLSRLGAVNLESLTELAELETRDRNLRVQFDDLTAAHRSLNDIIAAINEDSRRLFTETFALVRSHFQDLFRRLFGGGQADVILENEADVLESGVEVVARPPGKELRSISLMSGGEKTLTAVALLLAIFRSKPSPFCLLDEVDAALDEANTGRLALVIREFLDRSQFIIITHSKRTMAAADVLYGVTMQESGVSKRIAVRFEDWPEDGRQAA